MSPSTAVLSLSHPACEALPAERAGPVSVHELAFTMPVYPCTRVHGLAQVAMRAPTRLHVSPPVPRVPSAAWMNHVPGSPPRGPAAALCGGSS